MFSTINIKTQKRLYLKQPVVMKITFSRWCEMLFLLWQTFRRAFPSIDKSNFHRSIIYKNKPTFTIFLKVSNMEDPPNVIPIIQNAFYHSKGLKMTVNLTNLSKPINKNFEVHGVCIDETQCSFHLYRLQVLEMLFCFWLRPPLTNSQEESKLWITTNVVLWEKLRSLLHSNTLIFVLFLIDVIFTSIYSI